MITILVNTDDGEMDISAIGHAGYGPHGQDIVCAAISAIMQTAVLGLQAVAEQYPEHVQIRLQAPGETPEGLNAFNRGR